MHIEVPVYLISTDPNVSSVLPISLLTSRQTKVPGRAASVFCFLQGFSDEWLWESCSHIWILLLIAANSWEAPSSLANVSVLTGSHSFPSERVKESITLNIVTHAWRRKTYLPRLLDSYPHFLDKSISVQLGYSYQCFHHLHYISQSWCPCKSAFLFPRF